MTPWRVSRNGIDGSTPDSSGSGTIALASCPSPTPPSFFICNGIIGNVGQTTTPNFIEISELQNSIDRMFSNNYNAPSMISQILYDEFSVSSGRNIYSRCRMDVASDTFQPMVPQLISHGISTIYTLNENSGVCIPATSPIRRTPNTTHGSSSKYVVGKGTAAGAAVGD